MFDRDKSEYFPNYSLTVGKLKESLSKYDDNIVVSICGDPEAYLHVDVDPNNKDDVTITLDNLSAENIEE